MRSKWFDSKPQAIAMRKSGMSLREVEKKLGIPRSTLSGWFKNIKLTKKQQTKLKNKWLNNIIIARQQAIKWHMSQKQTRLREAEKHALGVLSKIDITDKSILELALAMLYLGEGTKSRQTSMGNSSPRILEFFINSLITVYDYDKDKIKCELHLRADQNPDIIKRFWSKQLDIPLKNFTSISIDKRTIGSATYPNYKGVCVVQCGNVALQRRLVYLSEKFCEQIAIARAVSSVGRASA